MQINEVGYNWKGSLSKRTKTNKIVLHHAAAKECDALTVHQWHLNNGWSGIGYHFFVRRNGKIYRGRPEYTVGSHTKGHNSDSIGICFEGDYSTQTMPKEQLEAGKELIAFLKNRYGNLPVKGHRDLMATSCPGKNFPFDEIAGYKVEPSNKTDENLILAFQKAAIADGAKLPKYGADGYYGEETEEAMKKCVVKRRIIHQYKNCTKLVQRLLNIDADGKCGPKTEQAIKNFQQQNQLVVDGHCGPKTWHKLLGVN